MDFSFFYPQNIFLCPSYKEDWNTINQAFQSLCKTCTLKEISEEVKHHLNERLGAFDSLANFEPIYFIDAIEISQETCSYQLILLNVNSDTTGQGIKGMREQSQVTYEPAAVIKLCNNYGHVLMRPEMLSDKISELFRKIEIDFDIEPEFSKNYFVLSEEEDLFTNTISRSTLNTIGKYKGLFIEINEGYMLIYLKKGLSKESISILANVSYQIIKSESLSEKN